MTCKNRTERNISQLNNFIMRTSHCVTLQLATAQTHNTVFLASLALQIFSLSTVFLQVNSEERKTLRRSFVICIY